MHDPHDGGELDRGGAGVGGVTRRGCEPGRVAAVADEHCRGRDILTIRRRSSGLGSTVPGMTEIGTDWRVVDGVATAWFDAPSLIEGAALAGRVVELSAEIVVDLRGDRHEGARRLRPARRSGVGGRRGISGCPRTLPCCSN